MKAALKRIVGSLTVLLAACGIQAGTLINNFTTAHNFVTDGIIGDTNWDGIYMGFGDVPGGNQGGSGAGATTAANTTLFGPGYLVVQTSGSDWAGAGDDGFFLYKVVKGDFDVSVACEPATLSGGTAFDNRAYNFAGLMVRAYDTNNSGTPFSTTSTNAAENFLNLWRFNEFSLDGQIRQSTNGVNIENSFPGSDSATNSPRYYRITRVGDTFTFYVKTNASDPWTLITDAATGGAYNPANGTVTRPDLHGVPMQVGIAQASFNTATRDAVFGDFQLTATNVSSYAMPAAPSDVVFSNPNPSGSKTISWTPAAGSDGSLVLVRANGPIISQPVQGTTYTGDSSFTNLNTLLSAAKTHIVYVGSGNSVTVSGLGGTNNNYNVAVFSYSTAGGTQPPVYNTASPATNSMTGPGQVASVSFTLSPASVPVGGVSVANVTATYTSGDSYDVSAATTTKWSSTDPNVAYATNGTVSGIAVGSATINATYAGVTGTGMVTVHTPPFTDDFSTYHDFVQGISGSKWDGVYLGATPGGTSPAGNVPVCVANIGANNAALTNLMVATTNNAMLGTVVSNDVLTVQSDNTFWTGSRDSGFFLYKKVSGDFQIAVHIASYTGQAFHFTGLMARPANADGTPYGGTEGWIYWDRFDEYSISTLMRNDVNASDQQFGQTDGDTSDFWLLMSRVDGTNFYFFKKANAGDPWSYQPDMTLVRPDLAGVPMEVGIDDATYSAAPLQQAQFDNFMLDGDGVVNLANAPSAPTDMTMTENADGTIDLSWAASTNGDGTLVAMRAGAPVSAQPVGGAAYNGNPVFGQGDDLGNFNYVVYVGAGTNVTVSGLNPGIRYYAAAYAYSGTNSATIYNITDVLKTNGVAQGVISNVLVNPEGSVIADEGILPYSVTVIYTNGVAQNVTASAIISSDPPALVGTNGIMTALTNGTATVFATFNGVTSTNDPVLTLRNPTYTDDFSASHDYVTGGTAGTMWDGVYLGANSFPGIAGGNDGSVSVCNANITSNNLLTVTSTLTDWAGSGDDGFLLFKYVPADFQAAVHVSSINRDTNGAANVGFQFAGLMARGYEPDGSALGGAENWVYWGEFEQYADSTESRYALDGVDNELPNYDGATNNFWLLMTRSGDTFRFYRRANAQDPWEPQPNQTIVQTNLTAGIPLQVGLFQALYSGNVGTVTFGHFMVDLGGPMLQASASGGSIVLSWPADPNVQLQSSPTLNPANWQPVSGSPTYANGQYSLTVPVGSGNQYFRLKR